MTGVVYKITFRDQVYIGQTTKFRVRKSRHIRSLKNNKHHSVYFQRLFNKYPESELLFEILYEDRLLNCPKILTIIEQVYINLYNAKLNMLPANRSCKGMKRSKDTLEKLRNSHINANAKVHKLYHPLEGELEIFNLHSFCKKHNYSSGAFCEMLQGKHTHVYGYYRSKEDYLKIPFKFPCVAKVNNKYKARIKFEKKVYHLGYFYTPQEAYEAVIIGKQIYGGKK